MERLVNEPTGCSIVAGRSVPAGGGARFVSVHATTGASLGVEYAAASSADVNDAAQAAWRAFHEARSAPPSVHADLLERTAEAIDAIASELLELASKETGLSVPRLKPELSRTTGTLKMLARVARDGSWAEAMIDLPGSDTRPMARADIRRVLRPLGPIAVFGASNFPLAYSTAGTDTASALAAGCPVIVKGHALHPGTGELVGHAAAAAVKAVGLPAGWFSFLHSGGERERDIGSELVRHPCVRGVGFTGSRAGGKALCDLAGRRPDPIPVFAEMGSVNPVAVLPRALRVEGPRIGKLLAQSVSSSAGQQCTCPGLIFVVDGPGLDGLIDGMAKELEQASAAPMLATRIQRQYAKGVRAQLGLDGVDILCGLARVPEPPPIGKNTGSATAPPVAPILLGTTARTFMTHPELTDEVFGPSALLVRCEDERRLLACCAAIVGSLTGSVFMAEGDELTAQRLATMFEQRCGRLIFNGVPTGVEVAWAMVHGGPEPTSSRPDSSAVGPTAMRRWRRAVCYQNAPGSVLPAELLNENPLGIERLVNGVRTREPLRTRPS